MTDLTDFILARIDEDEAAAERAGSHNGNGTFERDNYGCLLVQPARVLADCEAKRRIVEFAGELISKGVDSEPWAGEEVLVRLAAVYADHPDYREEWRP